ncbi:MAG: acetoacetate--CoA ligase [Myxococcota bacterium]|nr:acetoacetate--CoA ligase [Myxococcota bacterium]
MDAPLWRPSAERIAASGLTAFREHVERTGGGTHPDQASLHRWSVEAPDRFWSAVWSFCDVIAEARGDIVLRHGDRMPGAEWFPDARLNFAENLLRRRDDATALVFRGEDGTRHELTFAGLHERVSRLAQLLRERGIAPGDRVAAILPNHPDAVVAMLATTSLGAIWSSCSPDFGTRGVLDRFGQIGPRVLLVTDGYRYGGRRHDCLARAAEIRAALPSVELVLVVPGGAETPELAGLDGALLLDDALAPFQPTEIPFARLPFSHPVYVLYSSGTTGAPKCIVHGAGGTLLQHLKEHRLHADIGPDDRFFYFTTCGWMMWNWLASGLASGARLVLYDGSPFHPGPGALFDLAQDEAVTVFGISAKFVDAVAKERLTPRTTHDLSPLRTILSTGSPLAPEGFDFVYENVKEDVCLSSISGGTDIVSCFVAGSPALPVWRGELQCAGLGMRVEVWSPEGRRIRGEKGELVCTAPFPSMPVGFWNDPDGSRYRAAYFERFPGVWCHGDFAEETPHQGFLIHGRSDATLNPGGVRIGTAEIYRQVERVDEVLESLVIGQEWQNDTRIVLFVRLRDGEALDDDLVARIRDTIRRNASPRHVPAVVVQVADIPRTRSGKIVELAVRDVVHGRTVRNREALANPEALELFAGLAQLERP